MAGTSRCRACGARIRHEQTTLGRVVLLEAQPHPDGEVVVLLGGLFQAMPSDPPDLRHRMHPKRCWPVEHDHGGEA